MPKVRKKKFVDTIEPFAPAPEGFKEGRLARHHRLQEKQLRKMLQALDEER